MELFGEQLVRLSGNEDALEPGIFVLASVLCEFSDLDYPRCDYRERCRVATGDPTISVSPFLFQNILFCVLILHWLYSSRSIYYSFAAIGWL